MIDRRQQVHSACLTVVLGLIFAATGEAQATSVVTPAVSVGYAYDDNVLWRPAAQSDHLFRISPALSFTRTDIRSDMAGTFSLDGERFSRDRALTTVLARQHASFDSTWKTGPSASLGLEAAYDNSVTPAELNLTTGLDLGRTRAWRWYAGPLASKTVTPRTTVELSYRATGDYADLTPDSLTHDAVFGVRQAVGLRSELGVQYDTQWFDFQDAAIIWSQTGRLTWRWRLNPVARVEATGGVRVTDRRARPEADVRVTRSTTVSDMFAAYTLTETSALGYVGLVDVQRATAAAAYRRPGGWTATVNGGVFSNDIGGQHATVYDVGTEIARPIAGVLGIAASYTFAYQTALISRVPALAPVALESGATFVPTFVMNAAGQPVRRNFFLVRFYLSGSRRFAAGPAEPPRDGRPGATKLGKTDAH